MCELNDEEIFGVLDKIADYEQLLIELCAVIQDGHMQLTKTQYNAGKLLHVLSPSTILIQAC